MMARAAEAIARLGTAVGQGVDHMGSGEVVQRSIHGCQAYSFTPCREPAMDGLGCRVVSLAGQLLQHRDPPAGGADARSTQPLLEPLSRMSASLLHLGGVY